MDIEFRGGEDAFIIGIPARNLTEAEWHDLTDEQRAHATASGLYVAVDDAPAPHSDTQEAN